jgi:hypothetical protein
MSGGPAIPTDGLSYKMLPPVVERYYWWTTTIPLRAVYLVDSPTYISDGSPPGSIFHLADGDNPDDADHSGRLRYEPVRATLSRWWAGTTTDPLLLPSFPVVGCTHALVVTDDRRQAQLWASR